MTDLWLGPDLNADLLPLVQHPEQWAEARQSCAMLQLFEQQIGSDTENTNHVGLNFYPRLKDGGFFSALKTLGVPLALEMPGLKDWDTENGVPTGKQAAFAMVRAIERIRAAGGELQTFSLDDPFAASLKDFPAVVPLETLVSVLCRVAKAAIDLGVWGGITEAYPTCTAAQIIQMFEALQQAGWSPRHLHMDIDEQHAKQIHSDEQISQDLKSLHAHCTAWSIPFGIILNGQRGDTPDAYRAGFLEWWGFVRRMLGGDPDRYILESWKKNNLPANLPESSETSHTGLLREVAAASIPFPPEVPVSERQIAVVLPNDLAGAQVYVDDVGGGKTVIAESNGAHAVAPFSLVIGSNCTDAFTYVKVDREGYKPYTKHGVHLHAGPVQIRVGVERDPSRYSDTLLSPVQPLTTTVPRALVGPLRVVHHPASRTHSYADDTGPRRVLFCSWFCALRDWRDDPTKAAAVLDRVVVAGYQGVRIFRVLGESDTSGYFAGRAVLSDWSIPVLVDFLKACEARNLRVQLTCGRQWSAAERWAWESRCVQAVQAAGLAQMIALWEGDNEYWQNAPMRDSDEQIAFYGQLFAMVRSTLSPAPLCACGAPANEDPANLYRAATHSDILEKHGMRDEDRCVKRAFTPWYWEGDPGHFGKPMWEGEPIPYVHRDAFMGTTTMGRIVATLAMNQLVGNAVTFFSGEAVRGTDPTSAPGFADVPRLLAYLPEDVAQATHVPGGNIWWWQLPDGRFATVADGDYWGPSALTPPKPVKDYQIIGPGWTVREGTGAPKLEPTDGAALIVGNFA